MVTVQFWHVTCLVCLACALVPLCVVQACNVSDTSYNGSQAMLLSLVKKSSSVTSGLDRTVYGQVKVIDGCHFQVTNFTLIPSGLDVYFYAVPSRAPPADQPPYLARIVPYALGSYDGQTINFSLVPDYNWSDFAVVMIWSEQDKQAYGAFGVTKQVKDVFDLPDDNGANLQLNPNRAAYGKSLGVTRWWLVMFSLYSVWTFVL